MFLPKLVAPALVLSLVPFASAQWVTFVDETNSRLSAIPSLGSADVQEKDYAWADLDQDGDIDLVCVRKEPVTSTGRFPNVLFMNEGGVLVDRTTTLASASNVPSSQGFLDLTNDRDVAIADLNGDGWLDVVTATTLSGSFGKYISHPRVYINRGVDGAGTWLGLLFDDENRMPTMPDEPRFCAVAAGDIDGDGDLDLYFGDYQQGGNRPIDVNDRLFINDGTGYFSDQSSTRMSTVMLESSFGMAVAIADFNGDGKLDIMKDDALNAPQGVSISYNDTATEGFFGSYEIAYGNAPYHINTGDLNNDGRVDFVVSDDGQDRYAINTGNDAQGIAQFQSVAFSYASGVGDDGFGGNNIIADLNNDGFADVIVCDVDVDIAGCNRRVHIYRNLGNLPTPTLREELLNGAVASIPLNLLTGGHDVGVFDINGDGWLDLVLGRCSGTQVWIQQPPSGLVFSYPQGLPSFLQPGQSVTVDVQVAGLGAAVPAANSLQAFASVSGAPFAPLTVSDLGGNLYQANLPAIPCAATVRFYFSASTVGGATFSDPASAPLNTYDAVGANNLVTIYEDGFEAGAPGWSVVNSGPITSGAWQLADPNGTVSGGQQAAPEDDAEAITSAVTCWVTQNGAPGGAAGAADVDGGPTDLISPAFDLLGADGLISYRRWFFSDSSIPTNNDVFEVAVSGDGSSWITVETVTGAGNNSWISHSFRVSDFITPSATVRVRFRANDTPNNSLTEAGIDVFRVDRYECEVCQTNIGFGGPGSGVLSLCGGDLSSGTTALAKLENGPISSLVTFGVTDTVNPVPLGAGMIINPVPLALLDLPTDAAGEFSFVVPGGGGPFTLYGQCGWIDPAVPSGIAISNAVQADFLP